MNNHLHGTVPLQISTMIRWKRGVQSECEGLCQLKLDLNHLWGCFPQVAFDAIMHKSRQYSGQYQTYQNPRMSVGEGFVCSPESCAGVTTFTRKNVGMRLTIVAPARNQDWWYGKPPGPNTAHLDQMYKGKWTNTGVKLDRHSSRWEPSRGVNCANLEGCAGKKDDECCAPQLFLAKPPTCFEGTPARLP